MKHEGRDARLVRDDFDVLPGDAAAPTRAQRFQRRFFGGETRSIMLGGDGTTPVAIAAFARSEDALAEARRPLQHFAHAPNFDDIYAR